MKRKKHQTFTKTKRLTMTPTNSLAVLKNGATFCNFNMRKTISLKQFDRLGSAEDNE